MQDTLDDIWQDIVRSGAFIGGWRVERFEAEWAAYCGTRHSVGLASGTAALELALEALGIGPGDEVIVPTNSFIATASAVVSVGATPVFIDVDPERLLMTAAGVEAALTPRSSAVIVVHLFGHPVDMDAINRVAAAAGIAVIEDAAQAHGATWRGRCVGGLSDIGCFSFYPGKNLGALGDAGAIVTNDQRLAERIRMRSNHGRLADQPGVHLLCGGNHRLDALQAAVLSAKLKRLDDWNRARRQAAESYRSALAALSVSMVECSPEAESVHHLAVIRCDHRDALHARLQQSGIAVGIHYPIPCHRQPCFNDGRQASLPVAELAARQILSLPMFPHLDDATIDSITNVIEQFVATPAGADQLVS